MTESEIVLRGALEAAVRCIKGELPADGYVGDQKLLPTLERVLAMPDAGEPSAVEKAMHEQLESVRRMETQREAERAEHPKLRDLFAIAALQSPLVFRIHNSMVVAWCYEKADAMIKAREA
jgi:hypothetical protein